MFSTSHLYVGALLDEKRAAATAERLVPKAASQTGPFKARVSAAVKSTWSLLSGPADRPNAPVLMNYPFRG
jgi:hypothetical protein